MFEIVSLRLAFRINKNLIKLNQILPAIDEEVSSLGHIIYHSKIELLVRSSAIPDHGPKPIHKRKNVNKTK